MQILSEISKYIHTCVLLYLLTQVGQPEADVDLPI